MTYTATKIILKQMNIPLNIYIWIKHHYFLENSSIDLCSSSVFVGTLTVIWRCGFDVQCVNWINNIQWMFEFSLLTHRVASGRKTCLSLFSLSAVSLCSSVIGQHTHPERAVSKTLKSPTAESVVFPCKCLYQIFI